MMKRREFVNLTALAGGSFVALQSCNNSNPMEIKGILHYVLFWLREDLTAQEINDFANFFEELRPISQIKSLSYGRPADTNPRAVVDNSFSYNLVVLFDNLDDVNVYETHPIHLDAISKYSKFWTKVVVHDTVCG